MCRQESGSLFQSDAGALKVLTSTKDEWQNYLKEEKIKEDPEHAKNLKIKQNLPPKLTEVRWLFCLKHSTQMREVCSATRILIEACCLL